MRAILEHVRKQWRNLPGKDKAEELILEAMPFQRRNRNPSLAELRVRPGIEFSSRVRGALTSDETLLIISDPGVGKTHTILQVLEELVAANRIAGFIHFTATKSTQPEDWFANSLVVESRRGQPKIVLQPAPFLDVIRRRLKLKNDDSLVKSLPRRDTSKKVVVFIDEVTRANSVLLDTLLEAIENSTYLVEGRKVALPEILFIFAANPPGMDGSCATLTPAFKSRLTETLVLISDIDVLTDLYVPMALRKKLEVLEWADNEVLPDRALIRTAVCIWQMLGGYPLSRPGYANVTENTRRLIENVVALDLVLKGELEFIGRETSRGPDARKPIKWLQRCLRSVVQRQRDGDANASISDRDLLDTCVQVLATGYRVKFNEDDAQRMLELHQATHRVVSRVLNNPEIRTRLANSEGAYSLASLLADANL